MVWKVRPFDAIRAQLGDAPGDIGHETVRLDVGRAARTGAPEFILAASKSVDEVAASLVRLAECIGRSTATRCNDEQLINIPERLATSFDVNVDHIARAITVSKPSTARKRTGGRVGVMTAGSSDLPVAAEAKVIACELGCDVIEVSDVGVAGLHRLVQPLERLADARVHAIIVAAGMDGALPSVVAGL